MTALTVGAVESVEGASTRDAGRAKNLFALGVLSWLYGREAEVTHRWIEQKFAKRPAVMQANLAAFNAGWSFGETTELLEVQYRVAPARDVAPGTYRNVNGTTALSLGLIAASVRSGLPLVLASYPITPASELLHELSRHTRFGVSTIQAEDEIAAAGMALGAAFGGRLGVTATSGPGMDLKAETIGLAVMLELPMVIIDVQRAGPSTGMPTKTEQSDLLMALYGRHGESPLPVLAPTTPGGCFDAAFEAAAIAVRYRTPVILLSDTFLASSSEPWMIPAVGDLPGDRCRRSRPRRRPSCSCPTAATSASPGRGRSRAPRASSTGSVAWRRRTGAATSPTTAPTTSRMTELREAKVAGIADELPPLAVDSEPGASLLVLGWGSSEGAIRAGCPPGAGGRPQGRVRAAAPSQPAAGEHRRRAAVVRSGARSRAEHAASSPRCSAAKFLVDVESYGKVQGQPLFSGEIEQLIEERQ